MSKASYVERNAAPPHANLPHYRLRSHSIDVDLHVQPHFDVPPAYQGRVRRTRTPRETPDSSKTEHVFELMSSKGKPWASLAIQSSAKGPQQVPTFFERQAITGTVNLALSKDDPIQSVAVTVTGRLVTGATTSEMLTFFSYSHPIWAKSDAPLATRDTRLNGIVSWPFSFKLPPKVTVPNREGLMQTYLLPQTFMEENIRATIFYDLEVSIIRGKLRTNDFIRTQIAYIPTTRPTAPSQLRQLAYQENSPLLPPETDPDGWHVFPTVAMKDMNVELAVATPGSYTRGTVIPLFLTLFPSHFTQSDRKYSTLHPPTVRLTRRVMHTTQSQAVNLTDVIKNAVWWPTCEYGGEDGYSPQGIRRMYGEILLKKDLKPSMALSTFSIEYSIELLPPPMPLTHSLANSSSSNKSMLLSYPVEITTQHARGPKVKSYAPPTFEPEEERDYRDRQRYVLGVGKCVIGTAQL